jgi:predicted dehydrogenase
MTDRRDRLRVGVIGAGWVAANRHLPAYRRHRGAEVRAIFDPTPQRAAGLARRFGIPRHHHEIEPFLAQGLDIVSICSPPWAHAQQAVAALHAGAHVFCEKPMALTVADAESMVRAAGEAGRTICVSHNFLYSRAVMRAETLLSGDRPIHAAAVQLTSLHRRLPSWHERLPGGLFADETPHMVYLLRRFLGPLSLESATARTRAGSATPDAAQIVLAGRTGLGSLTFVSGAAISEWHLILTAPSAVVAIDLFRDVAVRVGQDGRHRALDVVRSSVRAIAGHATGVVTSGANIAVRRQSWGHGKLIGAFLDAVAAEAPSPVDPSESVETVRLTSRILDVAGLAAP